MRAARGQTGPLPGADFPALDREYMSKLFDVGYELAINGYPWQHTPARL
jgi:hypothetical protein